MKKLPLLLLLLLFSSLTFAEIKTFTKSIRQPFSGSQSADDARLAAIKKLEADISREAGEYIQTHTVLKDSQIEKDEVLAISASILKTQVIKDEPYVENGIFGLAITIKSTLDTSTIDKQINKILGSSEDKTRIKELQKREQELLAQINKLEKKNQEAKTEAEKKAVEVEYQQALKKAEAIKYLKLGYEVAKEKKYSLALGYFSKARVLDPNSTSAYIGRGIIYAELGNYSKAILEYNNAIQLDLELALVYYYRGNIYGKLGNYSQAIKDYTKAIELDSKFADAYYNRGNSYQNLGNYQQAILSYSQVIMLEPKDADVYYNRGLAYAKLGNYQQAIKDFSRTIELDKKYAGAYHNRGTAYANLGNFIQASQNARIACQLGTCRILEVLKKEGVYQP